VYACVAARHFRSFQVQHCQFPRSAERFTVRHNLANHSPFLCSARRQRLWVEQESLCTSCSSAITPGSENSVAWHNASGEVRNVVEGRTLAGHNHTGKQGILGVHMGASLDSRDHWNAYVGYILHNLNALGVNLAPSGGIGDVAERRKIDVRNKLAARSRQNYNLVRSILCNPINGIDKLRMILCRESEWPVVAVKFGNQDTFGVPSQF